MVIAVLAAVALLAFPGVAPAQESHWLLGVSQRGERPIRVNRFGDFSSPRKILVFGCIHGNECQGRKITRRLARHAIPAGIDVWIVHQLNPDGFRLGVRQNGRGVDLNRNFGSGWVPIGERWDPEYSGARPWSERETRLARKLILRARPDVTIWYHQPQAVVRAWGQSRKMARRYANLAGEPLPLHSLAARDGAELAEPPVPGHGVVRGRAARGVALGRGGRQARPCGEAVAAPVS
jgi:protein MpaA